MTSRSQNLGTARCGIGAVRKPAASVQATGAATNPRAVKAVPTNLEDMQTTAAKEGSNKRLKLAQTLLAILENSDDAVESN
jgi:hypothetical protein